jgi:hypothetical protein
MGFGSRVDFHSKVVSLRALLWSEDIRCRRRGIGWVGQSKVVLHGARYLSRHAQSIPFLSPANFLKYGLGVMERSLPTIPVYLRVFWCDYLTVTLQLERGGSR